MRCACSNSRVQVDVFQLEHLLAAEREQLP